MKIKRCPIVFNNIISYTTKCSHDEWPHAARELRNAVIKNGLYGTGPIIYQVSDFDEAVNEAQYTFYIPVNAAVKMAENEKYRFMDKLNIPDGLLIRHADLDESIGQSYQLLQACAEANDFSLQEPFYNIYLDVYGDGIIDIFAPIKEERND
ncbi:DUF5085 family protein [Cytobacillus sp. IB215316]|uniref:DUF5085 family protein n=1 Tax=Cytobacillus sp. IB215316 TaxID=3097354 RepID=UPI002A1779E8|nr:DUF5085 family protein [Cytobacillus sp. IB215316]MDX8360753.1 DUF5085 family protein [Cytobacillus sp. IB215316]